MASGEYVPTLAEIWEFLLGFKAATEAGFERMEARFERMEARFEGMQTQLDGMQGQLKGIDARLIRIESWHVDRRLDDHEQRILRLERQVRTD